MSRLLTLPSILTPDLGLLFWMLLAFLVVFFVLAKYGFPVMINMVESRKKYIDESLLKAREATERLENIKQEGENIIQEARLKQADMLKEALSTRDAIVAQAQEKALAESGRLIEEARAEIEMERQNAINSIKKQVAEMSVEIAQKVLLTHLSSEKEQMELIDRVIDEVTNSVNKR